MTAALAEKCQIVGDDMFVTDANRVRQAPADEIATACLLKPNQIGSLALTPETVTTCRAVGYAQMAPHRSGETTDPFIADFAVGIGCEQLNSGAPARGEGLAKYNRLLEIEHRSSLAYGLRDDDVRH